MATGSISTVKTTGTLMCRGVKRAQRLTTRHGSCFFSRSDRGVGTLAAPCTCVATVYFWVGCAGGGGGRGALPRCVCAHFRKWGDGDCRRQRPRPPYRPVGRCRVTTPHPRPHDSRDAVGPPAAASAECPPTHHGDGRHQAILRHCWGALAAQLPCRAAGVRARGGHPTAAVGGGAGPRGGSPPTTRATARGHVPGERARLTTPDARRGSHITKTKAPSLAQPEPPPTPSPPRHRRDPHFQPRPPPLCRPPPLTSKTRRVRAASAPPAPPTPPA